MALAVPSPTKAVQSAEYWRSGTRQSCGYGFPEKGLKRGLLGKILCPDATLTRGSIHNDKRIKGDVEQL